MAVKHKSKRKKVPADGGAHVRRLDATNVNTRFLEFLAGVLRKGVWWMPRLKKAMKDAAQMRNASGR